MPRGVKVMLLNDLLPKVDQYFNGENYDLETEDTGVIYQAYNNATDKSYIGRVFSFEKHGDDNPITPYGAKGRFRRHWSNKDSETAYNECPIFYDALRQSNLDDWFIYTLKVCSKKHLKDYETRLIKSYKTSDPKFGYNYFVGDNKPDNDVHLKKYQTAKAKSNADRAIGGGLRQKEHSKTLPPNINYRRSDKNGIVTEGYFVQIRLGGTLYNRAFLSKFDTMEHKLEQAIAQVATFKEIATNAKPKTTKKKIVKSGSKTLHPKKK